MSNVIERLRTFNQSRDPHLVQLKYKAMRTDVFAFYRGTCHLFYEDWSARTTLNEAPPAWICGDLHWQNLGSYKGDNRLVYFNISDFDEAVLAPCTWDLARLLVSFIVSASVLALKDNKTLGLGTYFLERYSRELALGRVRTIEEDKTVGLVRELLFQVRVRDWKAFLDSRTTLRDGRRALIVDGKRATAATDTERTMVASLIEKWAEQQANPHFFTVLDVAHRIAGVGSLGVERYVILVEGKGSPDQNYLLDLKAEEPSSLQPYLIVPQPRWQSEAERCVTIQRWAQSAPPALLTPLSHGETSYVLRELQPDEDKVNTEPLHGKYGRLEKLVKVIAKVVAWEQLRSAGHQGAADGHALISFAQSKDWHQPLLDYAQNYAKQVQEDYKAFCTAYDCGELTPLELRTLPV